MLDGHLKELWGRQRQEVQTCAQQFALHAHLWYFLGLGRPEDEYSSHGPSGPSSQQSYQTFIGWEARPRPLLPHL